jgi:hypothetical protein
MYRAALSNMQRAGAQDHPILGAHIVRLSVPCALTFLRYVRYEVLRAVKMSMPVFWVVRPPGFVGRYQRKVSKYFQNFKLIYLQS